MKLTYDDHCFGCGQANLNGIKLSFDLGDSTASTDFVAGDEHQSWTGIVHGGIVALALDEAIGWAAVAAGRPGVTGRLEIRFHQPLATGQRVKLTGQVDSIKRSLVFASARMQRTSDDVLVAEAKATLMQMDTTGIEQ